jgi:hypothetical protein
MPAGNPLPKGWLATPNTEYVYLRRQSVPGGYINSDNYPALLKAILDWAEAEDVSLTAAQSEFFLCTSDADPEYVQPEEDEEDYDEPYFGEFRADTEFSVQRGRGKGTVFQDVGDPIIIRGDGVNICVNCNAYGRVMTQHDGHPYCTTCRPTCECGKPFRPQVRLNDGVSIHGSNRVYMDKCLDCHKAAACPSCMHTFLTKNLGIKGLCADCVKFLTCKMCKEVFDNRSYFRGDGNTCNTCYVKRFDELVKDEVEFDKDEIPTNGMSFPKLASRPFRTVSIETEVDGDKEVLSGVLYACGIVKTPKVESYGSNPDGNLPWLCHLKHDGSVSGGELISHLLNLDRPTHAMGLMTMLKRMRALEKRDYIAYNANCGGHIHIDAHNFDYNDMWRLVTVFGYLEDVIYRLAGSGAKYGHRTLVPGHDDANHGQGYARPIIKGPFGSATGLKQAIQGQPRMCGLNFQHWLNAIGNCQCGAYRYDNHKECTCSLGKATIEWRVWNSTGSPRILHAWIAIMQSVHAFCDGEGAPSDEWLAQYPALTYTNTKWIATSEYHKAQSKSRLEWMFRNLTLTQDERVSLMYTIEKSEMAGIFTAAEKDLHIGMGNVEYAAKRAPRNPSKRLRSIVIKPADGKTAVGLDNNAVARAADRLILDWQARVAGQPVRVRR